MHTIPEEKMPAPRLELRWRDIEKQTDQNTVECVYSLVLSLGPHDIRAEREREDGEPLPNVMELSVQLGRTLSNNNAKRRYDSMRDEVQTPYRDGAHAQWDAEQLGGLPIYAVADGRAWLVPRNKEGA